MVNKIEDHCECPFDLHILKLIDTHLDFYYSLGFTPNMITTFGILMGIISFYEIFQGNYIIAAIFWLIAYYFDCADGKLARKYNMVTEFGDLYDHFGDIFKTLIVFYALFKSSRKKTTEKQWIYIAFVIIIGVLTLIHLGYQESMYDKKEESSFLHVFKKIISFDKNPERTIQYTRYFGCGTWILCVALVIIFWRK